MSEPLRMWTVYDRPSDFPNSCVARLWQINRGDPEPQATGEIIVGHTVEAVRQQLARCGLTCLARSEGDDPCVVETWL
jgi:hypothetical protein